ncbi:MAG: SH3-like domain-containing protein [Myxococcota bacterium]
MARIIIKKETSSMMRLLPLLILSLFFLSIGELQAFNKPVKTNYFASLRSNKTNVRAGPGLQYPIKFTVKLKGFPIKVISEYDNWSEIKDYEGDSGWISQGLISKKRTILVKTSKSFVNIYKKPTNRSRIILRIENNVVGNLLKCSKDYCGIKIDGEKGWISKKEAWGTN